MTPRGCLPSLLFAGRAKALGRKRLPELQAASMHPDDLPRLVRVRNAAQASLDVLAREDAVAGGAVATEIIELVERLYALGERLAEARRFCEKHSSENIARQKADIELEQVTAGVDQIKALKSELDALDTRARHAITVQGRIQTLVARLTSSAADLEAFEAKLGAELGSEDLLHELRAYRQSATLAIDAYIETAQELGL